MKDLTSPPPCYQAQITQDGRTVTVERHCTDPKCPGNA